MLKNLNSSPLDRQMHFSDLDMGQEYLFILPTAGESDCFILECSFLREVQNSEQLAALWMGSFCLFPLHLNL